MGEEGPPDISRNPPEKLMIDRTYRVCEGEAMKCPKCGSRMQELARLYYCLTDECSIDYIRFLPEMDERVKHRREEKVKGVGA